MPDAWLFPGLALSVLQLLAFLFTRKLRTISNIAEPDVTDDVELDKKAELFPLDDKNNEYHSNSNLSSETVVKK